MKKYINPKYSLLEAQTSDVITSSKGQFNVNCSQEEVTNDEGNIISNVIANVSSIFKK